MEILWTRRHRIRLFRVLSHSHGEPDFGETKTEADGTSAEQTRARNAPVVLAEQIVLLKRCVHAALCLFPSLV